MGRSGPGRPTHRRALALEFSSILNPTWDRTKIFFLSHHTLVEWLGETITRLPLGHYRTYPERKRKGNRNASRKNKKENRHNNLSRRRIFLPRELGCARNDRVLGMACTYAHSPDFHRDRGVLRNTEHLIQNVRS